MLRAALVDGRVRREGDGSEIREFLYVDDFADACVFLMRRYSEPDHINVGTGEDLTIDGLADMIRAIVYPDAQVIFDTSKPDGAPRRLLDVSRIHGLGWRHRMTLQKGLAATYEWFLYRGGDAPRSLQSVAVQ